MARSRGTSGFGGFAPALFAVGVLGLPTAGLALAGLDVGLGSDPAASSTPFTPANVDPELARRVQERIAARGQAIEQPVERDAVDVQTAGGERSQGLRVGQAASGPGQEQAEHGACGQGAAQAGGFHARLDLGRHTVERGAGVKGHRELSWLLQPSCDWADINAIQLQ